MSAKLGNTLTGVQLQQNGIHILTGMPVLHNKFRDNSNWSAITAEWDINTYRNAGITHTIILVVKLHSDHIVTRDKRNAPRLI